MKKSGLQSLENNYIPKENTVTLCYTVVVKKAITVDNVSPGFGNDPSHFLLKY